MTPSMRDPLVIPSEWDVVLAPELAPLFVLEAAIAAAQRFFSITLDPTSSGLGGADHPLTHDLLEAMRTLHVHIRHYRLVVAAEQGLTDSRHLDQDRPPRDEPDQGTL